MDEISITIAFALLALTWLTLRGNYIESVPHRPLQSALNEEGDIDGYGGRHGYGMPRRQGC